MDRIRARSHRRYVQAADRLRREIGDGLYRGRLPAEVELARTWGVSRGTVREALRLLAQEGVLRTVPGRGTFVGGSPAGEEARPPRSRLVGMVLPSIVRARAQMLVSGVEETLREAGYSLLLATSGDDQHLEAEQMQRLAAEGARGLILYAVDGPMRLPVLRALVESGVPVVLVDRFVPDLDVDAVAMDNLAGAFLAVAHLVELGYRRIGYVGTDNLGTSSIVERMAGYRWAVHAHGLAPDENLVCSSLRRLLSWPIQQADRAGAQHNQEVLRRYLGHRARPEAVYVSNDYVAYQVVEAAEAVGLNVPADLPVVGFDNAPYEEYQGVPLTTVEHPRRQIGATAATLLLERLEGRRTRRERILVPGRLIVRQSTGRPREAQPGGEALGSAAEAGG